MANASWVLTSAWLRASLADPVEAGRHAEERLLAGRVLHHTVERHLFPDCRFAIFDSPFVRAVFVPVVRGGENWAASFGRSPASVLPWA